MPSPALPVRAAVRPTKPVGLVWFGVAVTGQPVVAERKLFADKGRDFIRRETVRHALELGLRALGDQAAGVVP